MNKAPLKIVYLLLALVFVCFGCAGPSLIDISPNQNNGVVGLFDEGISHQDGKSASGLVINVAGDKNGLYAVALNSGVWKTQLNANGQFDSWQQLAQSPRYAYCIAVDPNSPNHIAVGEREGDGIDISQRNSGLWESYDG